MESSHLFMLLDIPIMSGSWSSMYFLFFSKDTNIAKIGIEQAKKGAKIVRENLQVQCGLSRTSLAFKINLKYETYSCIHGKNQINLTCKL